MMRWRFVFPVGRYAERASSGARRVQPRCVWWESTIVADSSLTNVYACSFERNTRGMKVRSQRTGTAQRAQCVRTTRTFLKISYLSPRHAWARRLTSGLIQPSTSNPLPTTAADLRFSTESFQDRIHPITAEPHLHVPLPQRSDVHHLVGQ